MNEEPELYTAVKAMAATIEELRAENARLKSEHREHMLRLRAYFAAKSVAHFSKDPAQAAEAVLKEAEFEKRILSELEAFTRRDVEELPFKEKEI